MVRAFGNAKARLIVVLVVLGIALIVGLVLGLRGCESDSSGTTAADIETTETDAASTTTIATATTELSTTTTKPKVAGSRVPTTAGAPTTVTTTANPFTGAYTGDYSFIDFEPRGSIHFVVAPNGGVTGFGTLGGTPFTLAGGATSGGALTMSGTVDDIEATYLITFVGNFSSGGGGVAGSCTLSNEGGTSNGAWSATNDSGA